MKILMVILSIGLIVPACIQKENKNDLFVIREEGYYDIDLLNKIYTVYYLEKKPLQIRYTLSKLEDEYIKTGIDSILNYSSTDIITIEDSCSYDPVFYTSLIVKFKKKSTTIGINLACSEQYLAENRNMALLIRRFLLTVKQMIESKDEIKYVPKSEHLRF